MAGETALDVDAVRARFPALGRKHGPGPAAYLDGPGGTQVPDDVVRAMSTILEEGVSNLGAPFDSSRAAERVMEAGRSAVADLLAADPEEISFGQNMTSITFAMSRALARDWGPEDAVVVTSLDHDANYTPWVMAAAERGAQVRVAEFDPAFGMLDTGSIERLLDDRVRLVAVAVASNALGSIVDVGRVTRLAHQAGALVYLDAVHAVPHRLLDVAEIGCDYMVASAYKFFGPHTGILYSRRETVARLHPYKVRPAPDTAPGKLETGTQSFESVAGVTAAVDYLASLGGSGNGRRRHRLQRAYELIAAHENTLARRFLAGIAGLDKVRLFGVPDPGPARVPTFAISVDGHHPRVVADRMADAGVYVWAGHYYAVNVIDRLGFSDRGGLIRIGFVHYNTDSEVDRALEVLASL